MLIFVMDMSLGNLFDFPLPRIKADFSHDKFKIIFYDLLLHRSSWNHFSDSVSTSESDSSPLERPISLSMPRFHLQIQNRFI